MTKLAEQVPAIQEALAEADLDGWLFLAFQHNDPVTLTMLGLDNRHVTRRHFYLIPRQGEPQKLTHRLEPWMLDELPGEETLYLEWRRLEEKLAELVSGTPRLAAQVEEGIGLPSISRLDIGTASFLHEHEVELVSSAELVQRFAAVWSPEQLESHRRAARELHRIVHAAFERVGEGLRGGEELREHQIAEFIREQFAAANLLTDEGPIVAVNAHAADPHYEPQTEGSALIRRGDLLLIDLWAKEKAAGSIYADITWCAACDTQPEERHQEIFGIVARARDAALELVREHYPDETVRGYEVDDACRAVIQEAGHGEHFFHRTGHSIDTSDHGQGANMDNLETHDTRQLVPMTGFSIEPGIYLEGDFGIRLEINVALTAEGAEVTGSEPQRELVTLL